MSARELANGIWALADGHVRSFLVLGTERGLVIDTAMGETDIIKVAREITDLPLILVNTHYHRDHTGRNSDFDAVYAHPGDLENIKASNPNLIPILHGHRFELGDRTVEVIHTPGHTPGAISLIDDTARVLFSGDNIADVPVFMQSADSNLEDYAQSIEKLIDLSSRYDTIIGCHGTCPLEPSYARKMLELVHAVEAGTCDEEIIEREFGGGKVSMRVVSYNGVSFYRPL